MGYGPYRRCQAPWLHKPFRPRTQKGRSVVPSPYSLTNVGRQFYDFGESEDVTMKQLKERIHNMLQSMATPGPLFLVFHDNSQDLKYLRSPEIDAPLDGLSFFLPESCKEAETSVTPKIYVVDTSELFAALEGDSGGQKRSLERVCRLLQIKSTFTQHLHNAGNDARVNDHPSSHPPLPGALKRDK